MTLRHILITLTAATVSFTALGQAAGNATFCNEAADTARLTEILISAVDAAGPSAEAQAMVLPMAELFIGTPYREDPLGEGDDTRVAICLDGMDCITFVETAIALAMTVGEGRSSWRDFAYNLEQTRYRGGRASGYPSRLHYFTDKALDCGRRGLLTEVTDRVISRADHLVKSLDWMTSHRSDYPALADSATFAAVKAIESGYHGHRSPYIKSGRVGEAALRSGDIVAFTTSRPGLDVAHAGIIKMVKGRPVLLHASSAAGKVTLEERPLADYLRRNRSLTGIRVFRLPAR